ncbi:hypothetical protein COY90_05560 [Candidatus Roizmanbacteria bacterium CG_4_10_14_0_8_um_filter_39_9]|uniref:Triosephosphate isomerase n=1 Tax=Candidatus Roizmanbacteria bacterium CG_4_10_14_0_8_um_filter_39_9 TaxID=1974829 RepID=A0A2M7QB99_9BACT|nr:MAG: hypothetical protein COY90_05560 [Candidatus Roizmanbacteria bacterium CG_4_10_14_0_8_um_filter_39_9]
MKYVIGNWKANKNYAEVKSWIFSFLEVYRPNKAIYGVAASYPFLSYLQKKFGGLPNILIGAQNVSTVEEGSCTGEVTAKSLQGIVSFAIIGHSERRKHFKESDQDLALKIIQAKKYGIEPIYCVRDENDPIPDGVKFVAYEPVAAIGTGQNEAPEKMLEMKKKIKLPKDCIFLYGGSVNEKNASSYFATKEVDGFLIGKASLDPLQFFAIGKQA